MVGQFSKDVSLAMIQLIKAVIEEKMGFENNRQDVVTVDFLIARTW